MTKFGFLARKASSAETPPEPTLASENPIEPDEESFSALGAQFGGENESLQPSASSRAHRQQEARESSRAPRRHPVFYCHRKTLA